MATGQRRDNLSTNEDDKCDMIKHTQYTEVHEGIMTLTTAPTPHWSHLKDAGELPYYFKTYI